MQIITRFALILLLLILAGCASVTPPPPDPLGKKRFKDEYDSNTPVERQSGSSVYLSQFGQMLRTYGIAEQSILGESFDLAAAGGGLPLSFEYMVSTAISRIGNPVVYAQLDPGLLGVNSGAAHASRIDADYAKRNYAQLSNATPEQIEYLKQTELFDAQQRFRSPIHYYSDSEFILRGSITEYDERLESENANVDGSIAIDNKTGDIGAAADTDRQLDKIAMDFFIANTNGRQNIPGVFASNSIQVLEYSSSGSVSFYLGGSGGGIGSRKAISTGKQAMVRELVDYSILQILGRLTYVPWWRCMDNHKPDSILISNLEYTLQNLEDEALVLTAKQYLIFFGYSNISLDTQKDKATVDAVREMRYRLGLPDSDRIDPELVLNLWLNVPLPWESERNSSLQLRQLSHANDKADSTETSMRDLPPLNEYQIELKNFDTSDLAELRTILSKVSDARRSSPQLTTSGNTMGTKTLNARIWSIDTLDNIVIEIQKALSSTSLDRHVYLAEVDHSKAKFIYRSI